MWIFFLNCWKRHQVFLWRLRKKNLKLISWGSVFDVLLQWPLNKVFQIGWRSEGHWSPWINFNFLFSVRQQWWNTLYVLLQLMSSYDIFQDKTIEGGSVLLNDILYTSKYHQVPKGWESLFYAIIFKIVFHKQNTSALFKFSSFTDYFTEILRVSKKN
jgi:hypothetical protein